METTAGKMPARSKRTFRSLLVLFFVVIIVVIIVVGKVAVLAVLGFLLIVVVIVFIGDKVEVDGMGLRNLEFRLAFRTTQDFAFFDFILVDIDFGGTFRAADHDLILRSVSRGVACNDATPHRSVLYT